MRIAVRVQRKDYFMKSGEKKPRFGVGNIVDVVIILVIALGLFFVYNKYMNKPEGEVVQETGNKKQVYLVAHAYRQKPSVAEALIEGDALVAQNKYQQGKIEKVTVTDNPYVTVDKEGQLIGETDPNEKMVEVEISCKANVSGPYVDSAGQLLKVGMGYWIKTEKVQIRGIIKKVTVEE